MAVLSIQNPTLLDIKKTLDPDGQPAQVVEILSETNEALEDLVFHEANDGTTHLNTVRTGFAEAAWRRLYGFTPPTKGTTAQVRDAIGMLESYAEADAAAVDMAPNPAAFRLLEDRAHIEGMNNELMQTLFYGNEGTAPSEFTGLAPRYNSLSAQNAMNIIDHGGSGSDNTSIWLCIWGQASGHMIYPRNSKTAGIAVKDMGEVTIVDPNGGGNMQAYRSHYKIHTGLTVRDWRYFVRIANIDVSALTTIANTAALVNSLIMATERVPNFNGKAALYMNRNLREKLRLGIQEKVSSTLTYETVAGKRVMMFDGIPVRRCDALLDSEARVT